MPAADEDLLDEQAHESLSTFEVKGVDPARDPLCEADDSPAERVVDREIVSFADQSIALFGEPGSPGIDLAGTSLQIGQFHETDLVEIGETTTFCGGRLELALEPGKFGGEQLVVGCRTVGGECALADEEHVRSQQCSPHLVEDEGIELVSSDVALRTTAVLAA